MRRIDYRVLFERILLAQAVLALALVWVVLIGKFLQLPERWEPGIDIGGDLKQHYAAGRIGGVRESGRLYTRFELGHEITRLFEPGAYEAGGRLKNFNYLYAPLVAWGAGRLAVFPYEDWVRGWFLLSLAALAGSAVLLAGLQEVRGRARPAEILLLLSLPPVAYGFSISQLNQVLLLVVAGALFCLDRGRPLLAGLIFSAAFIKPQFAVLAVALMLVFGLRRVALGAVAGAVVWGGLSLWVCGWKAHLHWFQSLLYTVQGRQIDEMATTVPWKGFILSLAPGAPPWLVTAACLGLLALVVVQVRRLLLRGGGAVPLESTRRFAVLLVLTALFSTYFKPYDLVVCIPWAWLAVCGPGGRQARLGWLELFWVGSAVAVLGRLLGGSYAAPLLTLWLVGSLAGGGKAENSAGGSARGCENNDLP